MRLTRRDFLIGSAALAAGTTVTAPFLLPKYHSRISDRSVPESRSSMLSNTPNNLTRFSPQVSASSRSMCEARRWF